MRSFVIYNIHQILWEWTSQWWWDGWNM